MHTQNHWAFTPGINARTRTAIFVLQALTAAIYSLLIKAK
jgi:hypothetical protein